MRCALWMSLPVACLLLACTPSPPEHEQRPEPQVKPSITANADAYKDAARDAAAKTQAQAARQ